MIYPQGVQLAELQSFNGVTTFGHSGDKSKLVTFCTTIKITYTAIVTDSRGVHDHPRTDLLKVLLPSSYKDKPDLLG